MEVERQRKFEDRQSKRESSLERGSEQKERDRKRNRIFF